MFYFKCNKKLEIIKVLVNPLSQYCRLHWKSYNQDIFEITEDKFEGISQSNDNFLKQFGMLMEVKSNSLEMGSRGHIVESPG